MKVFLAIVTFLICGFLSLKAQEGIGGKHKIYKVWVSLNNNPSVLDGELYSTKDSSIAYNYADNSYLFTRPTRFRLKKR